MLKLFNGLIISDNMDEAYKAMESISSSFIALYCEKGASQFSIEGKIYHARGKIQSCMGMCRWSTGMGNCFPKCRLDCRIFCTFAVI